MSLPSHSLFARSNCSNMAAPPIISWNTSVNSYNTAQWRRSGKHLPFIWKWRFPETPVLHMPAQIMYLPHIQLFYYKINRCRNQNAITKFQNLKHPIKKQNHKEHYTLHLLNSWCWVIFFFFRRSMDRNQRVNKRQKTSKSTVLPQAQAKGGIHKCVSFPGPPLEAALSISFR